MVERLLILKNALAKEKESHLMKSDSLNTDDDDSIVSNDLQRSSLSENVSQQNLPGLTPSLQTSPSIDFSNDQDEIANENSYLEKIKKRKQRRMMEAEVNL